MQNDKNFETKQKLAITLKQMMNSKPISKITITALVTKCKLNRKTFYYHFVDIYDLLEYIIKQEILNSLEELDIVKNLNKVIELIVNYVCDNKRIILNLVNDVKIDTIKIFFKNNIIHLLKKYINEVIVENNYNISDQFIEYSVKTVTSVIASTIYLWLINDETYEKSEVIANTTFIFENSLNSVLEKANNIK